MIQPLALLTTLTFTLPVYQSDRATLCAPNDTLVTLTSFSLWRTIQSPTWIAHHVAMLADRDTFAFYEPIVAQEADRQRVERNAVAPDARGTRVSIVAPLPGPCWYWITAESALGDGCWSNPVSVP